MDATYKRKLLCLLIVLTLISTIELELANSTSDFWNFQDFIFFDFNQSPTFASIPTLGASYDNSLIGYWNLDENIGSIAKATGSNDTSLLLSNPAPTWVNGKYNSALKFAGSDNAYLSSQSPFFASSFSFVCWFKRDGNSGGTSASSYHTLIAGLNGASTYDNRLLLSSGGQLLLAQIRVNGSVISSSLNISPDYSYHMYGFVYNGTTLSIIYDGYSYSSTSANGILSTGNNPFIIGRILPNTYLSNGTEDDIRIYNRPLGLDEIKRLYQMGPYYQPTPSDFNTFYNFTDSITGYTMFINAERQNYTSQNPISVKCVEFFTNNTLAFTANDTVKLNIWTDIAKPIYTSGIWNIQNCTTTLLLNASSLGILDWNTDIVPSASLISASTTYAGNATIFSTLWSDKYGLDNGGYIFSTNNTGQWVNATWMPFSINSYWGNHTLVLNSKAGLTVSFREYANNSVNLWGISSVYNITTSSLLMPISPSPTPTSTNMSTSVPTPKATLTPTPNPTTSNTFTTQPTYAPISPTLLSPLELIIFVLITGLSLLFFLLVTKGSISVQITYDTPGDNDEDYVI